MKQRTMDEMIAYFCQVVDKMDIDRKYKIAIFGMIAAFDCENKKQESSAQPEHKTGRWIIHKSPDRYHANMMECSECGFEDIEDDEFNYCPKCGVKMEE